MSVEISDENVIVEFHSEPNESRTTIKLLYVSDKTSICSMIFHLGDNQHFISKSLLLIKQLV